MASSVSLHHLINNFISKPQMTINYMPGQENNMLMERYGFSTPVNLWDAIEFSGDSCIHLNSFLSVFNIFGLLEEYYHDSELSGGDTFVDGAVIAAARTLPTWLDMSLPPIPSAERKAVKVLQDECRRCLRNIQQQQSKTRNC